MGALRSSNVVIAGPAVAGQERVLTPEALAFVADLVRRFRPTVARLLQERDQRQAAWDSGQRPGFLEETAELRAVDWLAPPPPADLVDRRVEITGPVDRKMIINALNSGASAFMADFEDATAPTWHNLINGQANLQDAIAGTIDYTDPESGKRYALARPHATLLVRPRGWHLPERHLLVDDRPAIGALVDFGLYVYHNARALLEAGSGPYLYLPKLQAHREARLWNAVFRHAQAGLGIPAGTIRATVLIETLPAAFEMDEILWELREHTAGLNCGRWDYIFSWIKSLRADPTCLLPDRGQVGMTQPNMRAYTQLVIKTCHRHGVHAIGGMAAQIPIKGDEAANAAALEQVRQDKLREVSDGHDGTWVAHPALVPVARAVFDAHMPGPNQIERQRPDVVADAAALLAVPCGARTSAGLRHNLRVGLQYLAAWLGGRGAVPLYNLMEDAATAEIARTQVWQWLRHGALLDDGQRVDETLVRRLLAEELALLRQGVAPAPPDQAAATGVAAQRLTEAAALIERLVTAPRLADFLTIPAYELLIARE